MLGPSTSASIFGDYYFAHCCGRPYGRDAHWLRFFGSIADRIVADFAPTTVLDAGCAWGLLVEALRDRGVDAWGVDISEYAIGQVAPAVRSYCRVGSVTDPLERRFDLIVTIEVLEHMLPVDADLAIANFAAHSDRVVFSSSPFDLREATHVGVRPAEGWAEAFARQGMFRDVNYDAGYITPWAVHYRREALTISALVGRYERWGFARDYAAREARAQALDTQRALAEAEARTRRLEELDARVVALDNEVKARTRERNDAVSALRAQTLEGNEAAIERQMALDQLGSAHATIRAMESSLFWRVRKPWAVISRWLRGA